MSTRRVVSDGRSGRWHRMKGLLVPVVTVAALIGAGATAQTAAAASVKVLRDPGALARHNAAHRMQKPRPLGHARTAGPLTSGSPHTVVTHIGGPALVYSDSNATGPFPDAHNLLDGSEMSAATVPAGCNIEPRLSPDGTTWVFVNYAGLDCTGTTVIYLMALDGSRDAVLATAPPNAFFDLPNWSPDGTTILYTMEQDDTNGQFVSSQLFTVPSAGGASTVVGGGGGDGFDGVYSPDGSKIAFAGDVSTSNYLSVMDANGANQVNFPSTTVSPFSPDLPAWSPDGTRISYQYDKMIGLFPNAGIGTVNADGTGNLLLPATAGLNTNAFTSSWSSDGTEIFYDAISSSTTTGDLLAFGSIYATDPSGSYRTTVLAATATDAFYDPFFVAPGPSTGSVSTFTPITPTRVQHNVPVGTNGFVDVQVAGGSSPVPAGATAVTLNLTGVLPTHATYLQVFPTPVSGSATPKISNLNLAAGQTAAVAVQVTVPASGMVRVRNYAGTTGVIVDVSGYFTAGTTAGGFVPLAQPDRVMDGSIAKGAHADVTVTGLAGAPANPVAVVLNLTADRPTQATYQSVVPSPLAGVPSVSNLNLAKGATRANLVTAQIGTGGKVSVFNYAGSARTIVDVIGYYTNDPGGLGYYPLDPTRVLDTRNGTNTSGGSTAPIGQNKTFDLLAWGTTTTSSAIVTVPATAQAVVFNLTAVYPSRGTYLTVYAAGAGARPTASNLNAAATTIVPNLVVSAVGGTGRVRIYNNAGSTPVVADMAGYYAP